MRFALVSNGVVKNVVEQDSTPTLPGQWVDITGLHVGPGYLYDGVTFTESASLGTKIRPSAFLDRFGASLIALYTAAMTNPQVQIYRDKVLMAATIDLAIPETINSVNSLVPALLTQEQANAILNNSVTENEL